MKKILFLTFIIFMFSFQNSFASDYDIVVAGGGMGGTSAAIQAARMGMKVLIIEPTSMLGGQATAAGVSTMDDMSGIESGLYHEFMNKIRAYYSAMHKSIATCYWKNYGKAFEPSVGNKILAEMAVSADILYHSSITTVKNESNERFVTVKTPDGIKNINFKILIDATEYGDILPLAGIKYRAGNSVSPNISDKAFIQDITWTTIIRKYPEGVPEHLKPKNPLPDYAKAKKNYEGYIAKNGFDFKGKYPVKMPVNLVSHNAYRAIPDSFTKGSYTGSKRDWRKITKTGVNWGNDYPGMYFWHGHYGLTVKYLEDMKLREQIEKDALLKTLHFIYYVQNELNEPWSVDENEYGELPEAAKDLPEEWQKIAKHFPPIPYVRESRRIVGSFTFNSKAVHENSMSWRNGQKNHEFKDSIAIGGYNLDVHGGDDDNDLEKELGEKQSSIYGNMPQGPFQVPMRILIPESADNFIAAEKNLSMSRLVSSALRLQPICMMTGQAAGALAAIAIKSEKQPREINAFYVQKVLADSGVVLSLCNYSDVARNNKFFGAVQLASLYELVKPKRYPDFPAKNINSSGTKGHKGNFGVYDRVTQKEFNEIVKRAETIMNKKLVLPEFNNKLNRGEAVEIIIEAMNEIK